MNDQVKTVLVEMRRREPDPRDYVWGTGSEVAAKDLCLCSHALVEPPDLSDRGLACDRSSREDGTEHPGLCHRRQLTSGELSQVVVGERQCWAKGQAGNESLKI